MGGMAVLALLEVDASYAVPIIGMALFGFGFGIVMPTVTDTIMAAVPVDEAGIGSSMNDTSRELGFALGVAILGSIETWAPELRRRAASHWAPGLFRS